MSIKSGHTMSTKYSSGQCFIDPACMVGHGERFEVGATACLLHSKQPFKSWRGLAWNFGALQTSGNWRFLFVAFVNVCVVAYGSLSASKYVVYVCLDHVCSTRYAYAYESIEPLIQSGR